MRYFNYLSRDEEADIFHLPPQTFNNTTDKEHLALAVGAALYMPATRQTIAEDLASSKLKGVASVVLDLEDAIGDEQAAEAEHSLVLQLHRLALLLETGKLDKEHLPLLFIRVRSPEQLDRMIESIGSCMKWLTGLVFPKFNAEIGERYLLQLQRYNESKPLPSPVLYGMPILETSEVLYRESRPQTLRAIKLLLDRYRDYILNVRIGATDFSSLFGLRRSPDMTIYDIHVVRDCITDIVNQFGRMADNYVLSGAVWEYFSPTGASDAFTEGLIREVKLDKENGLVGKTIIHPTHIGPVQALYVVTFEEYADATAIIAGNTGCQGVLKSQHNNKMNEIKPHLNWAERIMKRSTIYGVLNERQNFTALLGTAGQEPPHLQRIRGVGGHY